MTVGSATLGSDASQGEGDDAIPFAVKLLIAFLLLQGVEAVVELSLDLWATKVGRSQAFTSSNPYKPEYFQHLVWIVSCPLFAVLFYWRKQILLLTCCGGVPGANSHHLVQAATVRSFTRTQAG